MPRARQGAIAIALGLIVIAIFIRVNSDGADPVNFTNTVTPVLGELGSAHKHASLLISVNGSPYDLSDAKYMERSLFTHIHDNDGRYLHIHATGVTLDYFLTSLGIKLTSDCLTLDTGEGMCSGKMAGTEDVYRLSVLVNRKPIDDPALYEISDRDKILINYGTATDLELQLMSNSIPDLTEDLLSGVE
jgi:hypothetical protein